MIVRAQSPIVLKAKVTGRVGGKVSSFPHRAVLITTTVQHGPDAGAVVAVVAIQHEVDGDWHPTPGRWFLHTLCTSQDAREQQGAPTDVLAIDHGAGWSFSGLDGVIREAISVCAREGIRITFGGSA